MFSKLILSVLCLTSLTLAQNAPVLLWGSESPKRPALDFMESSTFSDILKNHLDSSMIVAFIEKQGTNENFLRCEKDDGQTCFANLKTQPQKSYYMNVEDAVSTLKTSSPNVEYLSVDNRGELETPVKYEKSKILIVSFDDLTGSEFADVIQSHDSAMSAIYKKLSGDGKVVAVYTTAAKILKRSVRATATETAATTGKLLYNTNIAFYYTSAELCTSSDATSCSALDFTGITIENATSGTDTLKVTLAGAASPLTFVLTNTQGYFTMSNLAYGSDTTFYVYPALEAELTFAYYCGNRSFSQILAATSTATPQVLNFDNLQIQVSFTGGLPADQTTFKFADAWHCVPFVSIPILAGLFVVAILLLITGTGICWLMDVNTMDRFDDPKGKTITINAAE